MKIRTNYVSNSSSSSFVVFEDLTSLGIACLKLTKKQAKKVLDSIKYDKHISSEVFESDYNTDVYLTEYICDCCGDKWDKLIDNRHLFYDEGEMQEEPRESDYYNEYRLGLSSVWLSKEHDKNKQLTKEETAKLIKEQAIANNFIVEYQSNGIFLRFTGD